MKIKTTDVELVLKEDELASLQAAWDVLRRIRGAFHVIDADTVAGYDYDQYLEAATFIDNVFRRARCERES